MTGQRRTMVRPSERARLWSGLDEASFAELAALPAGSDRLESAVSAAYGGAWLDVQRSVVLIVPSVVMRDERNDVIDPRRPDVAALDVPDAIEEFVFDARFARH